eukprot:1153357-Pelagomonas_calceolata.AAC.2
MRTELANPTHLCAHARQCAVISTEHFPFPIGKCASTAEQECGLIKKKENRQGCAVQEEMACTYVLVSFSKYSSIIQPDCNKNSMLNC